MSIFVRCFIIYIVFLFYRANDVKTGRACSGLALQPTTMQYRRATVAWRCICGRGPISFPCQSPVGVSRKNSCLPSRPGVLFPFICGMPWHGDAAFCLLRRRIGPKQAIVSKWADARRRF